MQIEGDESSGLWGIHLGFNVLIENDQGPSWPRSRLIETEGAKMDYILYFYTKPMPN